MSFDLNPQEMQRLLQIGVQLSAEKDLTALLSLILSETKALLKAEAASLYLVSRGKDGVERLRFMLTLNDRVDIPFHEFEIDINEQSLAGYVAKTRMMLRIADVYTLPDSYPFVLNRSFDQQTGFKSQSLLSVPLIDHKDQLIGVIQMWNKKGTGGSIGSFSIHDEAVMLSLSGQAAVAIENSTLYEDIQKLFEGFIRASVHAIESRDPTTSGHSERVATLTTELAKAISDTDMGPYKSVVFSEIELREIHYASLLHDFGKIGVREEVLTKAKKLFPLEIELVFQKLETWAAHLQASHFRRKCELLRQNISDDHPKMLHLEAELTQKLDEIRFLRDLISQANEPSILPAEVNSQLRALRSISIEQTFGPPTLLLSTDQWDKLHVTQGSLSITERLEIESHVSHTYQFLKRIPWTRELRRIPEIAYAHHEKINGLGYPRRLRIEEIPLPSKVMAVADVYDALVARDRPYKRALELEDALSILRAEARSGSLDPELVDLFIVQDIYKATL